MVLAFCVFNMLMMPVLGSLGEARLESGLKTGRNSVGAGRTSEKEGQIPGGRSEEAWETGLTKGTAREPGGRLHARLRTGLVHHNCWWL